MVITEAEVVFTWPWYVTGQDWGWVRCWEGISSDIWCSIQNMTCVPFPSWLPLQLAFFHRSHLLMHLWTLWDHRGNNCPAFLHLHLYWRSSVAAVPSPVEQAVLWCCSHTLLLRFWWNKPSLEDAVQLCSPLHFPTVMVDAGNGEDDLGMLRLQVLDSSFKVIFGASGEILCKDRLLSCSSPVLQFSGVSLWNPCRGLRQAVLSSFVSSISGTKESTWSRCGPPQSLP